MESEIGVAFDYTPESNCPLPLGSFIPPMRPAALTGWLSRHIPSGSWLVDPFCSNPLLPIVAAQTGYKVLVAANNPVLAFILETLALAPKKQDFLAAIAELAASRRGGERLEVDLLAQYATECPACGRKIPAKAFYWRKAEPVPYARLISCPYCFEEGEFPVSPYDIDRLNLPARDALHRARALERAGGTDQEAREAITEILTIYNPRPLNVLFTILNKITGLDISQANRRWLTALALSLCWEATSLHSWPASEKTIRLLTGPQQYVETNLWLALEDKAEDWCGINTPVQLTRYPEIPRGPGICLVPARLRTVLPLNPEIKPTGAVSIIPRPNQAFWTLSAVWSGWIWGHETTNSLHGSLDRRRYSWQWHANALHATFNILQQILPNGSLLRGFLPDLTPGFLSACLSAAEGAAFHLSDYAYLPDPPEAQLTWVDSDLPTSSPSRPYESLFRPVILNTLSQTYEPLPYLTLFMGGLTSLANQKQLPFRQAQLAADLIQQLQKSFSVILTDKRAIQRFDSVAQNLEAGLWWLTNPPAQPDWPLSDRIEREIVNQLVEKSELHIDQLQQHLCAVFSGLSSPSIAWIQKVLDSYAETVNEKPGFWRLRPAELPAARQTDISTAKKALVKIAGKLGYSTVNNNGSTLDWLSDGQPAYRFFVFASSAISRYILSPQPLPGDRCTLVIPGSRAALMAYKLRQNPYLKENCKDWHFLKFRQLYQIAQHPSLTLDVFTSLLDADPLTWTETVQMSLL